MMMIRPIIPISLSLLFIIIEFNVKRFHVTAFFPRTSWQSWSSSSAVASKRFVTTHHHHHHRLPAFYASVNGDSQATTFFDNDNNNNNNSTTEDNDDSVIGIGGVGGVVYDVNRLKRNLLQETMQSYKQTLWALLSSPTTTERAIVQKLAALVQQSPVRTTTDSNLLDGTWCRAYVSKFFTVHDLQNSTMTSRRSLPASSFLIAAGNRERRSGKEGPGRTVLRTFSLETFEDEHSLPVVVDEVRFLGGFLTKKRESTVQRLTRQSLELQPRWTEWSCMGKRFLRNERKDDEVPVSDIRNDSLQVVYLDVDLAILSDSSDYNDGKGPSSANTFSVYTKNQAWLDSKERAKRKAQFVVDSFKHRIRRDDGGSLSRSWPSKTYNKHNLDPILQEIQMDSARLRVLKLGDNDLDKNDDEESWDGMSDPFVHLTADERQHLLKQMNVRQIEIAGNQRLTQSRRDRWFQRLFKRRKTFFKKPDDL